MIYNGILFIGTALFYIYSYVYISANNFQCYPDAKNKCVLFNETKQEIKLGCQRRVKQLFLKYYISLCYYSHILIFKAYFFYVKNKFADSVLTVDQFLSLSPIDVNISYMYYLKCMCYYNQLYDTKLQTIFMFRIQKVLQELIRFFPKSTYVLVIQRKLFSINSVIFRENINVGMIYLYYYKHFSSINRFKKAIYRYQHYDFSAISFYRIIKIYYILREKQLSQKYFLLFLKLYPEDFLHNKLIFLFPSSLFSILKDAP